MQLNEQLKYFLKNLTSEPGVYRMRDVHDGVLYVGKASNLKKRVNSYFVKHNQSVKTNALVKQIASIDVTVTRSEIEALLLESSLIKTLRPKYNVLMRDDKSYPYIHLSLDHPYPSLSMIRSKVKPQSKHYFGPYPNIIAVRETLNIIQKIFNIRNCTDSYFNARTRPCLQYQLKRCQAPCTGLISEIDYRQAVLDATAFLQGKSQQVLAAFEARMQHAVDRLAFEEASYLRDQIKQLRLIQEQQHVILQKGDVDVIVIQAEVGFACVQWLSVRQGQILDNQSFFPEVPEEALGMDALWQQIFEAFVTHFYQNNPAKIPECIITDHVFPEQDVLTQILTEWRGSRCQIQVDVRGNKLNWLNFARNNLSHVVESRQNATLFMKKRFEILNKVLAQPTPIIRMVCFDISHTQGSQTMASCVVFDEKGPLKGDYRRFTIRDITPGDDYAAMEQVVSRYCRRLTHDTWPSLIIIDGGKGQVSIAKQVLEGIDHPEVQVLGIAKGPERKAGLERLILGDTMMEISLPSDSLALHLLQQIRDEAHRFAISAHRQKRQKSSLSTSLTSIPGIGTKRRQALLQRFGGIQALARAPVEEIIKVAGINQTLALEIYQHFHHQKKD